MSEELHCLLPYELTEEKDNTYSFITVGDIQYIAYFVCVSMYFDTFRDTYMFNFEPNTTNKPPNDPRVKKTILHIIELFFSNNENSMIYVCDSIDGREAYRKRLFNKWAVEYDLYEALTIHREDVESESEDFNLYASLLIKKDHPNIEEVISDFKKLPKMVM